MAKKVKQAKSEKETKVLTIDNISVGMTIPDSTKNSQEWEIDDDLIEQIRKYEQESGKSAIWKGKMTGMFLYFKYFEDHPEEKAKTKKKPGRKTKVEDEESVEEVIEESLDEEIESEIEDEENLLKDAIEDYKSEFGVKKVNVNTKKFKAFFK